MADRTRRITIGTREIGADRPCFIIAEAGINHNGDVKLAAELVEAAAEAGADAIKIQTHFPEHEMLRGGATAAYVGESLFDLLTRTAVSREDHFTLRDLAARKGIIFLSTPFSREAADFLETVGVPAFKTGSGELTHVPLQQHIARKGKPMIISTGMSTPEEIDRTVEAVRAVGTPFALMHCTSTYPTPYRARPARLHRGPAIEVRGAGRLLGPHAWQLRGVCGGRARREAVRETLHDVSHRSLVPISRARWSPENSTSWFAAYAPSNGPAARPRSSSPASRTCGTWPCTASCRSRTFAAGARIGADDVWAKRPGTGIPARQLGDVVGRAAKRAIGKDQLIGWDDLS